ncbi:RagB/SusD domain-containing protein [Gemmatirosa kalamazoonensis]|uniref:RagB/SusD domain-containing protein n=1 Tax=Gemmatirosa kalamazoonensis TaxID=861299 RepID=W0RHI6_9BACT|nr:RagB/SusD family nutrient uptake outer membrane protein [Gemmatirosa kalamazoonensis]AHG89785.1 RagB/SusD domain-containing protein [Gemmatirosa kalamazoonensis]
MNIFTKHPALCRTALALAAVAITWGCKDLLETSATPQGALNESTLANLTGVEGSLIAAYRALDCTDSNFAFGGCSASNWGLGSVPSDDAYKGSEAQDFPDMTDIENYHWGSSGVEGILNNKWQQVYEGVVRANSTLRLLKEVQTSNPAAVSADAAKGIQGEAIFLRAHYHFEAWRVWGNIGYYREDDHDFQKPNLTSDQVAAELLKDLDQAISLLLSTPRNGQVGRVTSWTAKAYKGRVQAYAGQWAEALKTLQDVKNNGPYALEPSYDRVWTGFKEFENGKETILAYQASANDGDPNGNNANTGERLNFPHSGSHFGCCGFHQPSQNLVNFFQVDANGLPLSLSSPSTWNARNDNLDAKASANVALDPRLDWTVGRDGVPYKDWGPHDPTWIRAPGFSGPYSPKKMQHEKASGAESNVGWVPTQLNSDNIHLYRYADLLLMLAEAEVESGSLENARAIVNQIRTRAGAKAQGPGTDRASIAVPLNDPSITWAKYKVGLYTQPWTDKNAARDAVRTERRLELAMEGQRFFDLRRWKIAEQVLNAYVAVEKNRRSYIAAAEPFTSRHLLYPIPQVQIELSKAGSTSNLKQNPGW